MASDFYARIAAAKRLGMHCTASWDEICAAGADMAQRNAAAARLGIAVGSSWDEICAAGADMAQRNAAAVKLGVAVDLMQQIKDLIDEINDMPETEMQEMHLLV